LEKKANHIKVTVLKCFDTREVFKEPPVKANYSGPCPIFKEGQVLYLDGVSMPSGFCPYAWLDIFPRVFLLMCGGNTPWYEEGVSVVCCSDGFRPVIFKLERTR
jgi:uncharacterized repeat protein (TIGR04076 family)